VKTEKSSNQDEGTESGGKQKRSNFMLLTALSAIVLATILAYSGVLSNFFNGDDYVHLTWLRQAVQQPELIWRNFHSSWLDGTTTRFYRPLISIFMVTDYLIWGANGLGFHITNLLFHISSSLLLFLVVRNIEPGERQSGRDTWALAAAAVFALYPLHPEAVSWITGRVDSIVTTFCLVSFYGYLRWRNQASKAGFAICITGMVLGLLSKEMAITLPALFAFWELVFGGTGKSTAGTLRNAVVKTLPMWLLLAGYFVLRRFALGTFVGGYDDSLFYIANLKGYVLGWLHSLKMFIVPINKDYLGSHDALTKIWQATLAVIGVLSAGTLIRNKASARVLIFTLGWLVLCLIPVYKLFNSISDDLQGTRLAYLATAPLAVLLTYFLSNLLSTRKAAYYARVATAVVLIGSCTALLWTNNQAWASAGNESRNIQLALRQFYSTVSGDPQVFIVALPDNIHGGYVCRNALSGMTKMPQLQRDIQNCLMVDRFDQILPFGYLKPSLYASRNEVRLLRWDSKNAALQPTNLPEASTAETIKSMPAGGLELRGGPGIKGRPEIPLDGIGADCWNIDFIQCDVTLAADHKPGKHTADLFYSNDIHPEYELAHRSPCEINPALTKQTLTFPLHNLPDWALGGKNHGLKLLFPENCHLTVTDIRSVPPASLLPKISFTNSGFTGSKGFLHISKVHPESAIIFDVNGTPGAHGVMWEITRPNVFFEEQNSAKQSPATKDKIISMSKTGELKIDVEKFPMIGLYEARAWAVDADGKPLSVSGDHIVISRDP
jgi:protein O-mannosyl-transferase